MTTRIPDAKGRTITLQPVSLGLALVCRDNADGTQRRPVLTPTAALAVADRLREWALSAAPIVDDRPALTPRQQEAFDAICGHQARTGLFPTSRELCVPLDVRSTNAVNLLLGTLAKKGYLVKLGERTARAWRVVRKEAA